MSLIYKDMKTEKNCVFKGKPVKKIKDHMLNLNTFKKQFMRLMSINMYFTSCIQLR